MTEKVNPSTNRPADAFETAGAIAEAGGAQSGWISPSASPSAIAVQDGDITEGNLNAFNDSTSGSSLDVTIDGGEAFVYGAWLAIDTQTTVTLAASTNSQTVYAGWAKDEPDNVIIGLDSAFDNTSANTDQRVPLFTYNTDGGGVTSTTDERTIDQTVTKRVDDETIDGEWQFQNGIVIPTGTDMYVQ